MIFDLRSLEVNLTAEAKRVNTFALVHETIHMLCFNTGLLSREADVRAASVKGWRPTGNSGAHRATRKRSAPSMSSDFSRSSGPEAGTVGSPSSELLTKDDLFDKPETEQARLRRGLVLVHYSSRAQLRKFQAYLAEFRSGLAKERIAYMRRPFWPARGH